MKKISILLLLLFMIPVMLHAETISTVYVDGKAPIIIDGVLSDWNTLNVPEIKIEKINSLSQLDEPRDEFDLSASFQCFADEDFIYVAINVIDDILIFGEEQVGKPYWDDCVEILLYGEKTGESPLKIWVSSTKDNLTKLEGREPINKKSFPYLWQAQGVRTKLVNSTKGYTVELVIPNKVMDQIGWNKKVPLGFNVGIYDDDDGNKYECILQWENISNHSYNIYVFEKIIQIPIKTLNIEENNDFEEKKLEIVINSPDNSKYYNDINTLYEYSTVLEKVGLYNDAILELESLLNVSSDDEITKYIKLALARNYCFSSIIKQGGVRINEKSRSFLIDLIDTKKFDTQEFSTIITFFELIKENRIKEIAQLYKNIRENHNDGRKSGYISYLRLIFSTFNIVDKINVEYDKLLESSY